MTAVLVVGGVSLAIIWGGALYHAFFVNRWKYKRKDKDNNSKS